MGENITILFIGKIQNDTFVYFYANFTGKCKCFFSYKNAQNKMKNSHQIRFNLKKSERMTRKYKNTKEILSRANFS